MRLRLETDAEEFARRVHGFQAYLLLHMNPKHVFSEKGRQGQGQQRFAGLRCTVSSVSPDFCTLLRHNFTLAVNCMIAERLGLGVAITTLWTYVLTVKGSSTECGRVQASIPESVARQVKQYNVYIDIWRVQLHQRGRRLEQSHPDPTQRPGKGEYLAHRFE